MHGHRNIKYILWLSVPANDLTQEVLPSKFCTQLANYHSNMSDLPQIVRIYSLNKFHRVQTHSQEKAVIPRDILEGVDSIIVQSWINMVRGCGLYSKGLNGSQIWSVANMGSAAVAKFSDNMFVVFFLLHYGEITHYQ
jgi:hypothetical protein